MSFLQDTTILSCTVQQGHPLLRERKIASYNQSQVGPLRSKASIASLVSAARNPVAAIADVLDGLRDGLTKEERIERQRLENKKQILYIRLRESTTYEDWKASAEALDYLEGSDVWKSVVDSPDYDAALIAARLGQLDEARISCDSGRMLFLIRTALTRGLGDMGNIRLYKHTHVGTKDLIERYISSALDTLSALLDISARSGCDSTESKRILEQVLFARQAFGRSALLLSGGATFGMNHIGVLKALWEARLLPRIISGASAGSIVCAVVCTRTDEEMPELLANFCYGDFAVFEEEGNEDGVLRKAARFLKFGALFDISHLTRVMKDILGNITFQEAYNRTRRILNICVSSASLYELPRLLNYVTAPNVLIWSAVAASCSVPFIFSAASILAKDPRTGEAVPWNPSPQRWIDGSVDNDIPMTRLAEMFNVNHFIVSQVNPHVVPFLIKEEDSIRAEAQRSTSTVATGPTWLHSMTNLAKGEALHRMHVMAELGVFPNTLTKAVSVLSQKYSGDITIFPEISYADFPRMLRNPTKESMLQAMLCGQRATWPKMSRIRNHCAIELALDDAVQKLRARIVFSRSQVDLRAALPRSISAASNVSGRGRGRDSTRPRRTSQSSKPMVPDATWETKTRILRSRPTDFHGTSVGASSKDGGTTRASHTFESILRKVPHTAPLIIPPLDLISSGAETSNATIFDSDDNETTELSSTESPSSPISPTSWSYVRPLFPFASQPATPAWSQRRFGFFHPPTTCPTSPPPLGATKSPDNPLDTLSMTPLEAATPSSPPPRHKRSAHQVPGHPVTETVLTSPIMSTASIGEHGLEIDLSGTRAMLRRKKSSSSVHRFGNEPSMKTMDREIHASKEHQRHCSG